MLIYGLKSTSFKCNLMQKSIKFYHNLSIIVISFYLNLMYDLCINYKLNECIMLLFYAQYITFKLQHKYILFKVHINKKKITIYINSMI